MGTCFEPSRRLRRHETSTSGFGRARPRLEEENDKYPVSKIIWMRGPSPHPQDRRARRDRLQKCFIGWHRIRTGIGMALPRDSIYLSVDALPEPLEPTRVRKVPTGIADLDSIVDGGFPSGSTILPLGDGGAGMQEDDYTAPAKNAFGNGRPQGPHHYPAGQWEPPRPSDQDCQATSV